MTIEDLIERYGEDRIINTIAIDKLSWEEIKDLDYLEDRIVTHLEWEGELEIVGVYEYDDEYQVIDSNRTVRFQGSKSDCKKYIKKNK